MSVVQLRGGVPCVFLETINATTGREHHFGVNLFYMVARNLGANPVKLYFTAEDFAGDVNYVTLPVKAATDPHGEWKGPVEASRVWLKATAATSAVEIVGFQRRG